MGKVILFVTEACNLSCRYCYQLNKGTEKKAFMREDDAREIARRLFTRATPCDFIQFFGGEPTLNMPAIRSFADETSRMVEDGILARKPKMAIVTNGASRYSRDLLTFCKNHDVGVTVSIDGPKDVHDAVRLDRRGVGTYDNVTGTIGQFLDAQLQVAAETVYTSLHMDRDVSIVDLFQFVQSLGIRKLVFHTAYPPAPPALCPFDDEHFDDLIRVHVDAVNWWFNSVVTESPIIIDMYFKDLLLPLLYGGGASVGGGGCPAGTRDYSIGPDGSVYSCHLLYGDPQFYLGNILSDEDLAPADGFPRRTSDFANCPNCFARHWCQPCGALNQGWGNLTVPPERECVLRRAVLSTIGKLAFESLVVPENPVTDVLRRACAVEAPALN